MVKPLGGTLTYNNNTIGFSNNVKIRYNRRNEYVENNNNVNLQIDEKRKVIFDKLKTYMSKDNNPNDLSYTDLSYAMELEGQLNIKDIKRDKKAEVVTFVCNDGINFTFDFETKAEVVEEPEEPEQPEKDIEIIHTLEFGDSLGNLAIKYHCTVKEIQDLNNIENPSRVSSDQKIKIPKYKKETWETYQDDLKQYDEKLEEYWDYQTKMDIYDNVKHASKEIKKGETYYPNDYSFELQYDENEHETGRVIICLEKNKTLYEVRTELGIPAGMLTYYNPELKEQPMEEIGDTGVYTRDTQDAYIGDKFEIPGHCLNPKEPTGHKIKDFFKNLFN